MKYVRYKSLLYSAVYIRFKSRQVLSTEFEVGIVATPEMLVTEGGQERNHDISLLI